MTTDRLDIALLFPRISVPSGGVEQTLKIIEHSEAANLRYTAFLSRDNILSPEVMRRLESLARGGRLEIRSLANGGPAPDRFDGIVVTSEFWMPALRKADRAGLRGPLLVKVHQLPYLGTLDVLKTVGVERPTPVDLARLPLVASHALHGSAAFFAFQLAACQLSVRALGRRRDARVMAVTPVTSSNLRTFGYRGPLFVPLVHVGMEPDRLRTTHEVPLEYDGVYVGRFHPHKGFLDLPLLAARMKKRLGREIRIAVCGSPQFPRHQEIFDRLVRSLHVEDNLVLMRWLNSERLYDTMRRSRALLYPSYVDAFSITVLESLCLGVPVLAYAIDALRMIWSKRAGVFLSTVGDPAAFAEAYGQLETSGRFEEARRTMRPQTDDLLREYTWERAVRFERDFYEGRSVGC